MADKAAVAKLYEPGAPSYGDKDLVIAAEGDAVSVSRLAGDGLVLVLNQEQYDAVAAWFRRKPKRGK